MITLRHSCLTGGCCFFLWVYTSGIHIPVDGSTADLAGSYHELESVSLFDNAGLPTSLCNETCIPNEVAWAQANLQSPAIPAACNSSCQSQHDSFLLSIQQDNPALSDSAQTGRKLLQSLPGPCEPDNCDNCCDNCCYQNGEGGDVSFARCPGGVDKCTILDAPPPPPPSPPCKGVQLCDSCSSQDQASCADPVRDDLPSTQITGYDCTTCDNTAKIRQIAATSGGGGSSGTDGGTIAFNVLKIVAAFA